jgi:hypothetical protein
MQYDDIIKSLRMNRPEHSKPDQLTKQIMQAVRNSDKTKSIYASIMESPAQWSFFNKTRIVLAFAALFLIVFFIVEQRGITSRIQKLETSAVAPVSPSTIPVVQQARFRQITELINKELPVDSLEEMLQVNRRSLNFLLFRIRELENENLTIREKLQQYYIDSTTTKNPKENEN